MNDQALDFESGIANARSQSGKVMKNIVKLRKTQGSPPGHGITSEDRLEYSNSSPRGDAKDYLDDDMRFENEDDVISEISGPMKYYEGVNVVRKKRVTFH